VKISELSRIALGSITPASTFAPVEDGTTTWRASIADMVQSVLNSPVLVGTTIGSANRAGAAMFDIYLGSSNKAWFTGQNWGFGYRSLTTTDPIGSGGPVLTVQRDSQYTGAMTGNPSAFTAVTNVGANVTGLDNVFISQLNLSAIAGVYTSGTIAGFKSGAGGSSMITLNVNSQDRTGRMSSVAGSNVPTEFDLWASGPDDAALRIGVDMIMGEYQPSSDGATTFTCAGVRTRGRELKVASSGAVSIPTSATVGNKVTTASEQGAGLTGSFGSGYLVDGATAAAFDASSAVQTRQTDNSFLAGVTTITLVNSTTAPSYVWPGALVTGAGIAAGTHVVTQSYNGSTQTTITIDTPTSGALALGQNLTFTNRIERGFRTSGFFGTAQYAGTGFSVDPAGNVNGLSMIVGASSGPTVTSGSGVPASTQPSGSVYLRTSGAAGARLYVTSGGGTWAAVAGV